VPSDSGVAEINFSGYTEKAIDKANLQQVYNNFIFAL
jgi:hypothetical protein